MKLPASLFSSCFCCLLLVFFAQHASCASCVYEIPPCEDGTSGAPLNQTANFVLSPSNPNQGRICITTEPNSEAVLIRIDNATGVFCTDKAFSSAVSVCARNVSGSHSMLQFSGEEAAGETNAMFNVDGQTRTQFLISYGPSGISRISPSTVRVVAAESATLSWTVRGSVNTSNLAVSPNPQSAQLQLTTVPCLLPHSDGTTATSFSQPLTATFTVSETDVEDTANYTLSENGQPSDPNAVIELIAEVPQAPPRLNSQAENVLFFEVATQGIINCDIIGTRRRPAWYRNNIPIQNGGGYFLRENRLRIEPVLFSHTGWYTCAASNEYGRIEKDYLVVVGAVSRIEVSPKTFMYQPNSQVVMPCSVAGAPYPTITWRKNGVPLIDGGDGMSISAISGALTISNSSSVGDMDQFSCLASNHFRNQSSPNGRIELAPFADELSPSTLRSEYTLANTGEQVTLVCNAQVPPLNPLKFAWYKNHVPLPGSTGNTLNVSWTENGSSWGHYCCEIKRTNGSVLLDRRCTMVTVRVKPTIVDAPINSSIPEGRSLNLLCTATTANRLDLPQLNWVRQRQTVTSDHTRLPGSSLSSRGIALHRVTNVTANSSGVYECEGGNFVKFIRTVSEMQIVGRCSSNLLRSSSAEEGETSARAVWSRVNTGSVSTLPDMTADTNGDRVFRLTATQMTNPRMGIEQVVNLPSNTTEVHFSGRMRSVNPDKAQPVVTLTITGVTQINITLPFPTLTSWQWVEQRMALNLTESTTARMTLTISSPSGTGEALFDDMCLSVSALQDNGDTMVSSPSPSATVTTQLVTDILPIVVGASVAAALVLLIVVVVIITILCCWNYNSKRSKKSRFFLLAFCKDREEKASDLNGSAAQQPAPSQELQTAYLEVLDSSDNAKEKDQSTEFYSYVSVDTPWMDRSPPIPIPANGPHYMKLLPTSTEQHLYTTANGVPSPLSAREPDALDGIDRELYESVNFQAEYVDPNPVRAAGRRTAKNLTGVTSTIL